MTAADPQARLAEIAERADAANPSLVLDAATLADWREITEHDVHRIAASAADVPYLLDRLRAAEAFKAEVMALADVLDGWTPLTIQADSVARRLRAIDARHFGGA